MGDWIGDPSVPGGVLALRPYVEDLSVLAYEEDIIDLLSDETIAEIEQALLDIALE